MLYLLRHGQTEWNSTGVFRGRKDIPLSEEGKVQAELSARALKDAGIKKIYSSPLKRALETAEAVSKIIGIEPVVLEGLTDLNFGLWEGQTLEWVKQNYKDEYYMYRNHPENCSIPGGESLPECFNRVAKLIENILSKNDIEKLPVLIVTHRVILKMAFLWVLSLPLSRFWHFQLDTCSITSFKIRDGMNILTRFNDTCHLENLRFGKIDF